MKVSSERFAGDSDGVDLLTEGTLSADPDVVHGFTTRLGGRSQGPLASLNLARRPGEHDALLRENWARVCAAVGLDSERLVLLEQVHGTECLHLDTPTGPLATAGPADAAVSTTPGLLLAVRVADCVPVLLAAPGGVAVAHAGWRGVVGGISAVTVAALCAATGAKPSAVTAVVGPCISGPAYQVDATVAQALDAIGGQGCLTPDGPGHWLADLRSEVDRQLRVAGVEHVGHVRRCTARHAAHYSHRADGPYTGRQAGVIALC